MADALLDEPQQISWIRLRQRDRELLLERGEYMLGKPPVADIALGGPNVSPCHARLVILSDVVTIESLGPVNDLLLNGERLGKTPRALRAGDCVWVGGEMLELIQIGKNGEPPGQSGTFTRTRTPELRSMSSVGALAERALGTRRVSDAVHMLEPALLRLLSDVRAGYSASQEALDVGIDYACKLATATGDGTWLGAAFDLLAASSAPYDEARGLLFEKALSKVESADARCIERCLEAFQRMPSSWERIRAVHHLKKMYRLALPKHR
jgi:hypothetical protein